jgi:hypothetical protein
MRELHVSPYLEAEMSRTFKYTQERGWDNSTYPFIPPKDGDNSLGFQCGREEHLANFFNDVSGLSYIVSSI